LTLGSSEPQSLGTEHNCIEPCVPPRATICESALKAAISPELILGSRGSTKKLAGRAWHALSVVLFSYTRQRTGTRRFPIIKRVNAVDVEWLLSGDRLQQNQRASEVSPPRPNCEIRALSGIQRCTQNASH
jgi:hypothetical protein